MNTLRQSLKIWINGTDNDTRMVHIPLMQTNKMLTIERYQDTRFRYSKRQHLFIGDCLPRPTTFIAGEHIMS
jgi:hypothetical protein